MIRKDCSLFLIENSNLDWYMVDLLVFWMQWLIFQLN